VQGSFTVQDNTYLDNEYNAVTGKGFNFTPQAGKTYKITCRYEASKGVGINGRFDILTGDTLQGNSDDWLASVFSNGTETLTGYFIGAGNPVRLLLRDYHSNDLSYTITIEEVNIPLYTTLDYSTPIPTNGSPVQGSLTMQDNTYLDMLHHAATGKGFSFTPQAGKTYKITCQYETLEKIHELCVVPQLYILTGDTLQGNMDDVLTEYFWNYVKLTGAFNKGIGSPVRLLLRGCNFINLSYTISIEEATVPSYTTISYPSITLGTPVTGTLSATVNEIVSPYDNAVTSGRGYTLAVEAGKVYDITCRYFTSQDTNLFVGLYWFAEGTSERNYNDMPAAGGGGSGTYASEWTETVTYSASSNGNIRILLMDYNLLNELMYSFEVHCTTCIDDIPANSLSKR
jgi:hypothetical protein